MIAPAVMGAGVLALYLPVLRELVEVWLAGGYYVYGFLVPLFSAYLAWKTPLAAVPAARAPRGLLVLAAGLALGTAGTAAASLTLCALSLPVTLYGAVWTLFGAARARRLAFPIGFLALMAPLPEGTLPALSLPLQRLAAVASEHALQALGVSVTRHDLFLTLPSITLHVTEACNGLRFLLAMLVIGTAFAGALALPPLRGAVLVLTALVLAIVANLARVTGTGVMAELWGPQAAMGTTHIVWGKVVYAVMLVPFAGVVLQLRRR